MFELKDYDEGAAAYFNSLKKSRLPLLSWDFYGAFFQDISQNLTDLKELETLAAANKWALNTDMGQIGKDVVIVVTDPEIRIVFSTQNIVKMTGYKNDEVFGKSPKMFQGKKTSKTIASEIREAINLHKPFDKTVVNYKKDGTAYDCNIKAFPVFNAKGELVHFIAFEKAA